jgi:CheY-like chemotaxis protein
MPHILIVDDDEAIRELLTVVLREEGYEATGATSVEAIRAALARPPDLILSDWLMPELDGPHLAALFRAVPALASTPLVIMTAFAARLAEAHFRAYTIAHVLRKPFDVDELLAVVRQFAPLPKEDT